jgi:hypothetical protein
LSFGRISFGSDRQLDVLEEEMLITHSQFRGLRYIAMAESCNATQAKSISAPIKFANSQ